VADDVADRIKTVADVLAHVREAAAAAAAR
jgi:hypothetical protein